MLQTSDSQWFPNSFQHPFFSLQFEKKGKRLHIIMESLTSFLNTRDIPCIVSQLQNYIPEVLETECFNASHLPFTEEVKHTEVAHLFEHILLAQMIKEQTKFGNDIAVYEGVTIWNWNKEKKGIFHIHVSVSQKDAFIFEKALDQSIKILEKIYYSHQEHVNKFPTSLQSVYLPIVYM